MRASLFIGLAFVACLYAPFRVGAVTLQQMSMQQLVDASTSIVQGEVTGISTSASGGTIFTHYAVKVDESWKGTVGATVDVALPGGVLNGRRQAFPGVPVLGTGQEYVLYLWVGADGQAQPVGMTQGIFTVTTDASGTTAAWRLASGELMVGPDGKAVVDQPVSLRLSAMRSQVQATVRGKSGK